MIDAKDIFKKTAEYVAVVQPELEKNAAAQIAFVKKAEGTVSVLVHRGIVDESKKTAMLEKLATDHTYALAILEQLAGIVGADQMGAPSHITKVSESKADPFVREYMPELITKSNTL
jgi:predicted deacylase